MDKEERRRRLLRVLQGFDDPEIPQDIQRQLRDNLRQAWADTVSQMSPLIAKDEAEAREDWIATTGHPMPDTFEEIEVSARLAGWNAAEAVAGEYTLAQLYGQATAAKILRDQRVEDEARARLAASSCSTVSEESRIANSLTTESRLVLAALDEWEADSLTNKMTRADIAARTGLSECVLRNVMERQLPKATVAMVQTKPGSGGGVWLTPEGTAVASTIDKKILPREDHSAAGKKY